MKTVTFNLDNDPQAYTLTYDFNSIADTESLTECNLLHALGSFGATTTATEHRALLFAFLRPAHPQVLLREAGELLTRDIGTVTKAMSTLILEHVANEDETEEVTPETVAA